MFYDNFLTLCKQKGEKPTPLMKKLGLSPGNLGKWQNGASVNSDILQKLSVHFGVSIDRLVNGTEDILTTDDEKELLNYYKELDERDKGRVIGKAEELVEAARRQKAITAAPAKKQSPKAIKLPEPELTEESEDEKEYIDLPFPDIPASAGTGMYLVSDYAETIHVLATDEARKADYAIKVSGKSMEPRYYDGDILAVCEQPAVDPGEVGVFVYNGERYVKQFGGNRLISINPDYQDIFIEDPDSFFCQGKVLSVLQIAKK